MRLVVLESPYAAPDPHGLALNLAYARDALADCLRRGEAPIASHLLYTQPRVLDDTKPEERELGIAAGLAWARKADAAVFYTDRGMSRGMADAQREHALNGVPIEFRSLGGTWAASGGKSR